MDMLLLTKGVDVQTIAEVIIFIPDATVVLN